MNKEKVNKFIQNRVCCFHMQSSAKTSQNVRLIFDSVIEHTLIKAVKDAMSSQRRNTHVSLCAVNGDHRPPARISKNSLESTMGSDGDSEKRYSFLRSKPSLEHVTHPPCPIREDSMKSQGDSLISTRKSSSHKSPVTVMNTQAVEGKSSFSSSERRRTSKRSPPSVSDLDKLRRTSTTAAIVQPRKSRGSMTIHADNNMVMSSPHPHEVHVGVDTSFCVTRVLETRHICSGSSESSALGEGDNTNGRRRKIGMSLHSIQDRHVEVIRHLFCVCWGRN
ncbi:uncharacterized protein LOC124142432 [Haliotis rufescens]|uniref:uncharacterized protein LOC124142432 n=1 Tax=Haliotis rufescens TaxID=6454 RepID=UPI00201F03EC|nr:uncharacterized protein LOC124142432 [Haliotis rufescens]